MTDFSFCSSYEDLGAWVIWTTFIMLFVIFGSFTTPGHGQELREHILVLNIVLKKKHNGCLDFFFTIN